jgi:5-methylcytosine-specific restriction endonuclease McrA
LNEQLALFRESAEAASVGNLGRAVEILGNMKSEEMRVWFEEHGQFSGQIRAEILSLPSPKPRTEQLVPLRSPAKFEKQVFERDSYTCRYCGLKLLDKEALVAFEKAVGAQHFRTQGTNAEQHGIVADHVFPYKYGGRTHPENLVAACPGCNYGKYWYTTEQIGIDDPLKYQPVFSKWDGLVSLVSGLKMHALQ